MGQIASEVLIERLADWGANTGAVSTLNST